MEEKTLEEIIKPLAADDRNWNTQEVAEATFAKACEEWGLIEYERGHENGVLDAE